jgi:hypothetical protein
MMSLVSSYPSQAASSTSKVSGDRIGDHLLVIKHSELSCLPTQPSLQENFCGCQGRPQGISTTPGRLSLSDKVSLCTSNVRSVCSDESNSRTNLCRDRNRMDSAFHCRRSSHDYDSDGPDSECSGDKHLLLLSLPS